MLVNELEKKSTPNSSNQDEISKQKSSGLKAIKEGWTQFIPLFHRPHLRYACVVFSIQFLLLCSWNTFRLWLPQIFAIFIEYEEGLASNSSGFKEESLCTLIEADVIKSNQLYADKLGTVECNAVRIMSNVNYKELKIIL